jgi:tetratricopeptide (TPR) repeat protein
MARSVVHLLKEARKAIDIKDYAAALKHCKEALETDPKNYNALIFAGVSYANLTPPQPQKSEQAYKDAVTIDSNNPLAWQVKDQIICLSFVHQPTVIILCLLSVRFQSSHAYVNT